MHYSSWSSYLRTAVIAKHTSATFIENYGLCSTGVLYNCAHICELSRTGRMPSETVLLCLEEQYRLAVTLF